MKKTIQKALNGIKQWQIEEDTHAKKIILTTIGNKPVEVLGAIEALVPAMWTVEWKEGFEAEFKEAMKPKRGKKITRAS